MKNDFLAEVEAIRAYVLTEAARRATEPQPQLAEPGKGGDKPRGQ